jgi:hypothetical protein
VIVTNERKWMNTITMTVEEWAKIPDNPRQRDTIAHAAKAMKKHLGSYSPAQRFVSASVVGGRVVCKLDGHTRSHLWTSGKLERPKDNTVIVQLIEAASIEEAAEHYTHYDNQYAAENANDRLCGATKENSLVLQSPLFKKAFSSALAIASRISKGQAPHTSSTPPIYDLVKEWREELVVMDSFGLPASKLTYPSVGVCLSILRKQPQASALLCQFMFEASTDGGSSIEGNKTGSKLLYDYTVDIKRGGLTGNRTTYNREVAEKTYNAWVVFKEGGTRRAIKGTSIAALAV